jgi:hypothetical protein
MLVCELIERLKKVDPLSKVFCNLSFNERNIKFEVQTEIIDIYEKGEYRDKCALFYITTEINKEK